MPDERAGADPGAVAAVPLPRFRLHMVSLVFLLFPICMRASTFWMMRRDLTPAQMAYLVGHFALRYGLILGVAWLAAYISFRALRRSNVAGNLMLCVNLVLLTVLVTVFAPMPSNMDRSDALRDVLAQLHQARPRLPHVLDVDGPLDADLDATLNVIRHAAAEADENDQRVLQSLLEEAEKMAAVILQQRQAYREFVQAGGLDLRTATSKPEFQRRLRALHAVETAASTILEQTAGLHRRLRADIVSRGARIDPVADDLSRFDALLSDDLLREQLNDRRVIVAASSLLHSLEFGLGQWSYDTEREEFSSNYASLNQRYLIIKQHLPSAGLRPNGLFNVFIPPRP